MASLRKHPKSPYWIACITLPDGRRTNRSTGTTDRKEAKRIATKFEDASSEGKIGRLTEARARKTIADIFAIANRGTLPSSSIRAFLESWLARKELEAGPKTHQKYAGVADGFLRFLGSKAHKDLLHLSSRDFSEYRDQLSDRVSPGTVNVSLKILRSAMEQAKRDGLLDVNEASRVTLIKRKTGGFQRRPFTEEEIRRVLQVVDGEWRGMVLFGLYTGQRLGDLAALRWSNIDLVAKEIIFSSEKTRRQQVIPMHDQLIRYLSSGPVNDDPSAPLFPEINAIRQRSTHNGTLSNQFHEILVRAGLAQKTDHKARKQGRSAKRQQNALSFHSLRHTATSWLKNAGASDAVAQDIIGHESRAVSAHYTHLDIAVKREAISKLPDMI